MTAPSRKRAWLLLGAVVIALAIGLSAIVVLTNAQARAGLPVGFAVARDSAAAFVRAVEALGDRIASVAWGALAIGLLFSLLNMALRLSLATVVYSRIAIPVRWQRRDMGPRWV